MVVDELSLANNVGKIMRLILVIPVLLPFFGSAQIDYENPPWSLPCDSLYSQTDMTICSYRKSRMADSILNLYFKLLDDQFTEMYQSELNRKEDADLYAIELYKNIISDLKESQLQFEVYRKSCVDLESDLWDGGSVRPLMCNSVHLSLTIDRIRHLEAKYFERESY